MTIDEALEELDTLLIPRDGMQDRLADAYDMAVKALRHKRACINKIREAYHDNEHMSPEFNAGLSCALSILEGGAV